jgi:hypothetical protein
MKEKFNHKSVLSNSEDLKRFSIHKKLDLSV